MTFKITQSQDFFPSPIFKSQFQPSGDVYFTKRMDTKEYNRLMAALQGKSYLVV